MSNFKSTVNKVKINKNKIINCSFIIIIIYCYYLIITIVVASIVINVIVIGVTV